MKLMSLFKKKKTHKKAESENIQGKIPKFKFNSWYTKVKISPHAKNTKSASLQLGVVQCSSPPRKRALSILKQGMFDPLQYHNSIRHISWQGPTLPSPCRFSDACFYFFFRKTITDFLSHKKKKKKFEAWELSHARCII